MEALRAGGVRRVVVRGLPYGRHQQDTIVAGPDGRLYLGSGSTCDACVESDPRSAAILSFRPDGSDLRVVATGLRNPYGLVFANGSLYATVNGRDDLGKNEPAEMVVRIRRGADYGWPSCWPGYALAQADRRVQGRPPLQSRTSSRTRRLTGSPRGAATSSSPSGASTSHARTDDVSCASAVDTRRPSRPVSIIRSRSPSAPAATCLSRTGAGA